MILAFLNFLVEKIKYKTFCAIIYDPKSFHDSIAAIHYRCSNKSHRKLLNIDVA